MRQIRRNLIKSRINNLFAIFVTLFIVIACGSSKVYESYNSLETNSWGEDDIQSFLFEITDASKPFDLFFTIKNGLDYPYHNLYVKYKLIEKEGDKDVVLAEGLEEYILFNPKTGEPYGSGSSGWYDHEFVIENAFQFKKEGKFEIQFQQYMRKGALAEVATVGFAFDAPSEKQ